MLLFIGKYTHHQRRRGNLKKSVGTYILIFGVLSWQRKVKLKPTHIILKAYIDKLDSHTSMIRKEQKLWECGEKNYISFIFLKAIQFNFEDCEMNERLSEFALHAHEKATYIKIKENWVKL